MSETKPLLYVAAAVLIDPDNRVLIQQRPEGKPYASYWEFPGGKIDPGETPVLALKRELQEELDIVTTEKAFFPLTFFSGDYPERHVINLIFGCRNWIGLPKGLEGQQFAWARVPRLYDYDLLHKNKDILPVLEQLI